MTVPGVGPLAALRSVAAIDAPGRFATAHQVQSYLGLTPGEHSSSERERRTGITKAGQMELRRTLVQAGWAAMCRVRTSPPMNDWARRVAERRGRPVAAVAMARKLAGILFAMWRDGTTYQSKRSANAVKHAWPPSPPTQRLQRTQVKVVQRRREHRAPAWYAASVRVCALSFSVSFSSDV